MEMEKASAFREKEYINQSSSVEFQPNEHINGIFDILYRPAPSELDADVNGDIVF